MQKALDKLWGSLFVESLFLYPVYLKKVLSGNFNITMTGIREAILAAKLRIQRMEESMCTTNGTDQLQEFSLAQMECVLKDAKMSLAGLEQMEALFGNPENNLDYLK